MQLAQLVLLSNLQNGLTQYALDIKDGNEEDDQATVSSPQNNLNIQIEHLPIKLMCDSIASLPLSIIYLMVH